MRSATSFFDKTLFRSQLKHTWPLWLGYTALWLFLVPVALFSELSAYQGGYSAADASSLLLNTGVRGGVFISFFFGLFFAMLAFSPRWGTWSVTLRPARSPCGARPSF